MVSFGYIIVNILHKCDNKVINNNIKRIYLRDILKFIYFLANYTRSPLKVSDIDNW